ncbi:MAG TPA: L-histidine N(alpha)-methyltransferase [Gaiellaceae bacterium]|nr:L-histidine N(alpha)-methyltransferase [Gaiellaceae bacterium]
MTDGTSPATLQVDVYLTPEDRLAALREDARNGLTSTPKELPPKWFYDERGSELFEEITRLPEYYLTDCEREILAERADDVARLTAANTLVEPGSGSSEKTRLLLDAMVEAGHLRRFVPFDVSEQALREAAAAIADDYPGIEVHGVVGDFEHHLVWLPEGHRRLFAFLGSSIGNLTGEQRAGFLNALHGLLGPGEALLLGADLVKDPARLELAYNDSRGVTAEFNRNVLSVVNRELGGDFDLSSFTHVARWDAEHEWMEMLLRSDVDQRVRITDLELEVEFAAGEEMRTEISDKFRRSGLERELCEAGFQLAHWWQDRSDAFALSLSFSAEQT